jgi:propionyl-CoA carboxylase alpha chain
VIRRLLVANRGEIARRVFRTCRELGIGTVAVFSDADADAPHAAEADLAVRLPGSAAADTYLRPELLVEAARTTGADAVHPGYGFLSEDAGFARAVIEAGLTWVGPPPDAIESMGSKIAAKKIMADAGVPVLPQLAGQDVTEDDLPVLVKAAAGGGGRGMRIVRALNELPAAIKAASAEAAAAFGDPTVFCEPYLEAGRHIEVQVLADRHGRVWSVGERECSIQRRHQKVLEEAPSPLVDEPMRARLCDAAVAATKAVGYVGAGTVEFLADPGADPGADHGADHGADPERPGAFFFLEMNTRLQVEHPVTEAVTGLDLVRWQLAIAEGAALGTYPPRVDGHAIEARLYAEDPAQGWRPQTGRVRRFAVPGEDGDVIRVDSGVVDGSVVTTHYDPMLAKVIAWAPTRAEAARRLATALAQARIHGVTTNRDLLVRVLRHPAFLAGDTDTAFLDRHGLDELARPLADDRAVELSALAAVLADAERRRATARVQRGVPSGWRNVPSQPQRKAYETGQRSVEVAYHRTRTGVHLEGPSGWRGCDIPAPKLGKFHIVDDEATGTVGVAVGGVHYTFDVTSYGDELVCVESVLGAVSLRPVARFPDPSEHVAAGSLLAPMPGAITAVHVAEGDRVTAGSVIVELEAMKMRHSVAAASDGVVRTLSAAVGAQVEAGSVLAVVTPDAVTPDAVGSDAVGSDAEVRD